MSEKNAEKDAEEHDCDGSDENPMPCWPACVTPPETHDGSPR